MCGIVAYWARESVLTRKQYDVLLEGAQQRGQDGFGIAIHDRHRDMTYKLKVLGPYASERDNVLAFIKEYMAVGSILVASCRATPETEKTTTRDMLQPIIYDDMILSHNGGVTDSVKKEFGYNYRTEIDSEAIIAAYCTNHNNMRLAMEDLSGSFAFVFVDTLHDRMFGVTSFNPLAHMYIKGYGYFYHSDNEVLQEVLQMITGATRDGMNVWESWYHHYLPGYTIIETDLESGSQRQTKYRPRFLHPKWDALKQPNPLAQNKTYVIASGGIDSGLTAYLLKLVGRDVTMIHFNYGQKSEDSEAWAIKQLSKRTAIPYLFIALGLLYNKLVDPSMLLKDNIPITSGGEDIKSTVAWVAGRNAIFSAIVLAFAETSIFNWNYGTVDIAAGWAQLSEETGGYPDNSFYFMEALKQLKDFGYITGHRINFLPVLQRITKTECWALGHALEFPFELTVSCDDPEMLWVSERVSEKSDMAPYLCQECGSTKLSIIAADRACVQDIRLFKTERKKLSEPSCVASHRDIIDRLILTAAEKETLKGLL
jgi:7-cyano-7-deazaguanine synthase